MSTHSPGPWSVKTDAYGWDRIVDAEGRGIADLPGCSHGTNPNGRLMAAAPDLLEACELLLSFVYCSGVWCGFPCCNTCHSIEQAKSAIKKAKGEQ